jgi:LytS/YehU family sensor histidine kinase
MDPDFRLLGVVPINYSEKIEKLMVSDVFHAEGHKFTSVLIHNEEYLLSIDPNPWYAVRFLWLLPIYAGIASVVWISLKLQQARRKEKDRTRAEIQQWQLKYTLAQLDPHFTFNALSAIGSVIRNERSDEAYDYVVRFTRLMRSSLENSEKITWSLREEVRFVEHYLKLQQLRFGHKFEFAIHVETSVDQRLPVPKMLIQHYADNAVKHGLRSLESGGQLDIVIARGGSDLEVRIKDNGIGRASAVRDRVADSVGRGEQLSRQLAAQYSKLTGRKIRLKVTDLFDTSHHPAGTAVLISISTDRSG